LGGGHLSFGPPQTKLFGETRPPVPQGSTVMLSSVDLQLISTNKLNNLKNKFDFCVDSNQFSYRLSTLLQR